MVSYWDLLPTLADRDWFFRLLAHSCTWTNVYSLEDFPLEHEHRGFQNAVLV